MCRGASDSAELATPRARRLALRELVAGVSLEIGECPLAGFARGREIPAQVARWYDSVWADLGRVTAGWRIHGAVGHVCVPTRQVCIHQEPVPCRSPVGARYS